ncbi:25423_t:CDS:2, partial [Dentiscutata erythropus]
MFKSDDQNLVNNSSVMPLLESMSSNVVNAEPKQDQNHQNHNNCTQIPLNETTRENGHYLPMTIVSSMASQSWESADETVKAEYRRIAKEALRVHNEMHPKSGRRKRKDRWNIVSFDPPAPPLKKMRGDIKIKILIQKSIKEIINNKNIEPKDTKPVIFVTSSHNINSTLDYPLKCIQTRHPYLQTILRISIHLLYLLWSHRVGNLLMRLSSRMAKEALG